MELYKRLCYLGASVLFIHHASDKGEAFYRGSSDIKAVIDAALHLCRADGSGSADALGQLELEEFKTRGMIGGKVRMEFRDNGFQTLDTPRQSPREMVKELIRSHPSATTRELVTLARGLGLAKHTVIENLTSLILKREVSTTPGKRHTVHHYIPGQSGAQENIAPEPGV
jgi:hypothetical protein